MNKGSDLLGEAFLDHVSPPESTDGTREIGLKSGNHMQLKKCNSEDRSVLSLEIGPPSDQVPTCSGKHFFFLPFPKRGSEVLMSDMMKIFVEEVLGSSARRCFFPGVRGSFFMVDRHPLGNTRCMFWLVWDTQLQHFDTTC